MLGARLIVLPIVLPWTFSLIASLPIEPAEQTSIPDTTPSKTIAAESVGGSKESTSSTPGTVQKAPANKTAATAQPKTPQTPSKAKTPTAKTQDPTPAAKSPSILQMLEGHETELMLAAAIAVAFFFIGWICGGNYYLRRDRLRRRKIRF